MSRKNKAAEPKPDEDLSDYRILLSCMRKRLEGYGMMEALDRLEQLDDAILEAIMDRIQPPLTSAIN
ncbi:MAG TPA: hypothetical protein VG819_04810 [Rhizomicrobium sp.]|jgi:hypothetical protein|nr:hypothetical protein [Rhizomicrobium sp.]